MTTQSKNVHCASCGTGVTLWHVTPTGNLCMSCHTWEDLKRTVAVLPRARKAELLLALTQEFVTIAVTNNRAVGGG